MLVKNLLKRGLSVLICAAMLAVMFTSVTALADGYEITQSTFTDELNNTEYLYSYPDGSENCGGWKLTQRNEEFTDNGKPVNVNGYKVTYNDQINNWSIPEYVNITYKAGGNKKFTKATFTIWINDSLAKKELFPIVKEKKADADSEFETVSGVEWKTLITGTETGTKWLSKAECTVYFPEGAVEAGLGFKLVNDAGVGSSDFIFDKAEFMTGNEAKKFYDDCSSLDNMWLVKNLKADSDVVGEGDYNNNGHMIGVQKENKPYEAIYKMPEGRKLTYLSMEYSVQDSQEPKIEFSSDGVSFTDSTLKGVGSNKAGTAGDAKWADVKTVTYTPSESDNIQFIKISGKTPGNYQFYLRKVCIMSEGGEIDSKVVDDDLSGGTAERYSVSNFVPYNLINKDEAGQIANKTNALTFHDKDLLAVKDVKKDAYITYKASEGRVFTGIDLNQLTRDGGGNIKVWASKDGNNFDNIGVTNNDLGFIGGENNSSNIDAGWNKLINTKAAFTKQDGYTYIKLIQPASTLSNSNWFKLSNVKLTISSAYSLFKKDGETETDLNGKAENGENLFGKIYYTPKSGETKFYAIIALKENGIIKNIGLNNFENVTSDKKVFETPVLENCDIKDNTVVEVYLFNNDSLKPVLSEKGEFSSK